MSNVTESLEGVSLVNGLVPRRLLREEIIYSVAKEKDYNVLHELKYWDQRTQFFKQIQSKQLLLQSIVAHHLGVSSDVCHVAEPRKWIHGSFNVCIGIDIDATTRHCGRQVMIRLPLPYKLGEDRHPGNIDEKIRCEAGTYVWLQENCPTIPIPELYGFGLTTGQSFTALESRPLMTRMIWFLRRTISKWLGYQVATRYIPRTCTEASALGTGYLLIEYIDSSQGEMLSNTWPEKRHDPELRQTLFRDLSRTLLSLSRIPVSKIGSFTVDNNGYLTLSNRPLTLDIHYLENQNIPIDIPRDSTHTSTETYINDLFSIHESRFRHQPNAVNNIQDAFYQACGLTMMRSVWPCFFRRDLLRGPFFFSLTDLHQSNIFVDEDWNLTCIIDLEWAYTRPVEMIHPPSWLSNQPLQLIDEAQYTPLHGEFMALFEEEEKALSPVMQPPFPWFPILKQGLEKGTLWCSYALNSPGAIFDMFYRHIQPRFAKSHIDEDSFWLITMPYWGFDSYQFLENKLDDKARYDEDLRKVFERKPDEYDATE